MDLHPADGKVATTKHDTKGGVTKDYVWKLSGFRPGYDETSDDRHYGFYGGMIQLYAEGNGQQYQINARGDYSAKPEPAIPADATIELTLQPEGLLIDGSEGKPLVLKQRPADVKGFMDRVTRGVPIARYSATARIILADGSAKPGRIVLISGNTSKEAPPPADRVMLEFLQYGPPSTSVNRVADLTVLITF